MLAKADPELVQLLSAIQIYEQFARLLQDAFDECLWRMTGASAALTSSQMAELQTVRRAAHAVPKLYREVFDALGRYGEAQQFDQTFGPLAEPLQPTDWVRRLLEHHRNVQKRKQPNGKVPWLIFLELGRYQVRAAYRRDQPVTVSDEYVHQYRAVPLFSFALDLGMVK